VLSSRTMVRLVVHPDTADRLWYASSTVFILWMVMLHEWPRFLIRSRIWCAGDLCRRRMRALEWHGRHKREPCFHTEGAYPSCGFTSLHTRHSIWFGSVCWVKYCVRPLSLAHTTSSKMCPAQKLAHFPEGKPLFGSQLVHVHQQEVHNGHESEACEPPAPHATERLRRGCTTCAGPLNVQSTRTQRCSRSCVRFCSTSQRQKNYPKMWQLIPPQLDGPSLVFRFRP
jgi:hypothetical protein